MPLPTPLPPLTLFFDGVCNLCVRSVQFVISHDPERKFRFASLQSKAGQQLLKTHPLLTAGPGSFILVENGKVYTRSTAAVRVARQLNAGWPLLYALVIIPPFARNAVYDWVAKNRYKWFGKKETCWMPTAELNHLFLG